LPNYNLLILDQQKTIATPAMDCADALAIFGKNLGVKLTLDQGDMPYAPYRLDEWEVGPHWVNCTIPVF
jgi:hypothetical protein